MRILNFYCVATLAALLSHAVLADPLVWAPYPVPSPTPLPTPGAVPTQTPAPIPAVVPTIPSEIPIKAFFASPQFSQMSLSPNGKFVAALAPIHGRSNLVTIDLATNKPTVATDYDSRDVARFTWVNDTRLEYSMNDRQSGLAEQPIGGLFAIDRDGQNFTEISPVGPTGVLPVGDVGAYRHYVFAGRDSKPNSDSVFALGNQRNIRYFDYYLINTRTREKKLLTADAPPQVSRWVTDTEGVVRAAVGQVKGVQSNWYRDSIDAPWKKLAEYTLKDAKLWSPIGFDFDGKTMYVTTNQGADTEGIYKFNFATNQPEAEPFFAPHNYDTTSAQLVYDYEAKEIVGVNFEADRRQTYWIAPRWARVQAMLDKTFPDHSNTIIRGTDDKRLLVLSASDTDPGRYYLFDLVTHELTESLVARPDINPQLMSPMKVMTYTARDGLVIPAYLTIPRNSSGKNLPLIVDVHGGPYVRDNHWGWNGEVQFLASRGYAVLQPEFRGTLGYGTKLFRSGWKQWGLGMQDDLTDGVRWAIAQGIADPKRICIYGASYGGYAVMMGLAKDPELYRCGVNYVGVTDINLMYDVTWSDSADSDWMKYYMPEMIGDPKDDAAQLKATSPLANAAKIKRPVLMAYGGGDRRVPLIHGEEMRDALRKNNVPVEWVVYSEEGHGFLKLSNREDFYARVEKFLAEQLK